jgi:hypothetical protein
MAKMTITEALSEVNLVKKKIEHKKKEVLGLLVKPQHAKDLYAEEGGTKIHVSKELQSIGDLEIRLVKLRSAISLANIEHDITIGEFTRPIHDWLTWKREISKDQMAFINTIVSTVKTTLDRSNAQPQCYEDTEGKKHIVVIESMIDYPEMIRHQEKLATIFENLDGQLSLKNATIVINV